MTSVDPSISIRRAAPADAASLLAIYAPIVEKTAISFEPQPPSVAEFARRIEKALSRWEWLVAEAQGRCVGYAYGSQHRERAAYEWSVEVSAYVDPSHWRKGIGGRLYGELLGRLGQAGFHMAYAGVALPNEASVRLHRAAGFEPIGVFREAGRKFDRWHDVAWFQKRL